MRRIIALFFLTISLPPFVYSQQKGNIAKPKNLITPHLSFPVNTSSQNNCSFTNNAGETKNKVFLSWINTNAYAATITIEERKQLLRAKWKEMLFGVDIFYPNFKIEEIKGWLEGKSEVHFFNMIEGKATLKRNEVKYIFKMRF
ncbi:MAG: hypothetical protein B6D56_07105 [Candidatus Omnitrophica bacterium 4484_70.1]|nr:MAG: hypothetical protein B6D56_07105 [Candidatus Omnitrophica bacterium 4484_70.1]